MKFRHYIFYVLLIWQLPVFSQSVAIKEVTGLPSRVLYSVLVDKKGFLWMTHDLGISRYDGVNFINFYNKQQTSLSGTGLIEDAYGRIWFNNFTGQIFYIENEKMHLLAGYDYKHEATFPHIALYHGQIVATSSKGLFFCDTKTLQCRYVKCSNPSGHTNTNSLAVMHDKIVLYGDGLWFIYTDKQGLKQVALKGFGADMIRANTSNLNQATFKDTAFVSSNPAGILTKLTASDTSIALTSQTGYNNFINTINVTDKDYWVNTVESSFLNKGQQKIEGYDLTGIVTDKEENTWYSSLKGGLFVHYNQVDWKKIDIAANGPGTTVRCVQQKNGYLLLGTFGGKIITYSIKDARIVDQVAVPGTPAVVSIIYPLDDFDFVVCNAFKSYLFNTVSKQFTVLPAAAVKQVTATANSICMASANGLLVFPKVYSLKWEDTIKRQFPGMVVQRYNKPYFFVYKQRAKAICFDPESKNVYVAFKDGIYYINSKGIFPFLYKNAPVYALSLIYANGKVVIGTIDDGLIIIDHGQVKNISANEGLSTNAVFKMNSFGNHLWILGAGAIQVLDLKTLSFKNNYNLPSVADANIADFAEVNDTAYVATSTLLYKVPLMEEAQVPKFKNYLLGMQLNSRDTPLVAGSILHHYENNLQFTLGVPVYHNAGDVYFKYRLKGDNNGAWQVTKTGDRSVAFPSLMPGSYVFEAIAQHPQLGPAESPVQYSFTILPPWWQTWWFKFMLALFIAGLVFYMVRLYYLNRLRTIRLTYEKELAIQDERHRISSEMHDDIGAGLSAIKLFAGMAKTRSDAGNIAEMDKIYAMLSDLSDKIREVIWSLNVDNDTLENLIYYIQFQATKIFQYADIEFDSDMPDNLPAIVVNGVMRRNIYLVIKELLHNALKHSKATNVTLNFDVKNEKLLVNIRDNGIGIKNTKAMPDSMGMKSIAQRVKTLHGTVHIATDEGTKIDLQIPLENLNHL